MSVKSITENWESRNCGIDDKGIITFVRVWHVVTDDDTTGTATSEVEILKASPYQIYSPFPEYQSCVLKSIRAECIRTLQYWKLVLTWNNAPYDPADRADTKDKKDGGNKADPKQNPQSIEIEYQPYEFVLSEDQLGNRIENSAHDPFAPAPTITKFQKVLRVTVDIDPIQLNSIDGIKGTNNANDITFGPNNEVTVPAGTGFMGPARAVPKNKNGTDVYETTFTVMIRDDPDDWLLKLLDHGPNELDGNSPTSKSPILIKGIPVKDHALNGGGASEEPDILTFYPYALAPWEDSGLFNQGNGGLGGPNAQPNPLLPQKPLQVPVPNAKNAL